MNLAIVDLFVNVFQSIFNLVVSYRLFEELYLFLVIGLAASIIIKFVKGVQS